MLTVLFYAALIYVALRMLVWGIKAAWGLAKIIAFVVLLPVMIVGLAMAGMVMLAAGLLVLFVILSTIGMLIWP
ncbi:MAG: hypothetical protein IJ757_08880 [Clostridiales bacterium]|nr:hypothetical protein [Clostridiales bacterium]